MYPGTDPRMRASDDDRKRVVAALERHTAAGRLSLDEYAERVTHVYRAATQQDLAVVTRDLPTEPPVATAAVSRQLLGAFALAIMTLVVLFVILALAK
jgi:hypothetical protein